MSTLASGDPRPATASVSLLLLHLVLPASAAATAGMVGVDAGAGAPKAAVLGVHASDMDKDQVTGLTEILAVELARTGRFRVITQSDVNSLVDLSTQQEILGCDEGDCLQTLSELGGSLNVDRLLTGNVTQVSGGKILNVVLMDPRSSSVVGRGQAPLGEGLDNTISAVRQGLLEALGYSGRIVLWNQPEGAQVYLDGRPVGNTPVAAIYVERPAKYRLQVFHDDRTPWERDVEVNKGAVMRVKVDSVSLLELEEAADSRTAWGKGFVSLGAATAIASGAFWFLAGKAQRDFDETDWRGKTASDQQPYTDAITSRTTTAALLSAVAVASLTTGGVMILRNDHRDRLDSLTSSSGGVSLSAVPSADGVVALLSGSFF